MVLQVRALLLLLTGCPRNALTQVLLRAGPEREPLVYACSWWNAEQVRLAPPCLPARFWLRRSCLQANCRKPDRAECAQVVHSRGMTSTTLLWRWMQVDEFLRDKSQPIWVSLSQGHVELYRYEHILLTSKQASIVWHQDKPTLTIGFWLLLAETFRLYTWAIMSSWSSCWSARGRFGGGSTYSGTSNSP